MLKQIVCLSDTHGQHRRIRVPDGDILIVAGDLTAYGKRSEYRYFNEWLGELPHKHKIVIAGNHDKAIYYMPKESAQRRLSNAVYLLDSEVTVEGIRIYGSPWTPNFCNWYFMLDRGPKIRAKWDLIPQGIDILVTHGPPIGYLDWAQYSSEHMGCEELRLAVERMKPKLHVFGHNHMDRGEARNENTLFMNVSVCEDGTGAVHDPMVVHWPFDVWGEETLL